MVRVSILRERPDVGSSNRRMVGSLIRACPTIAAQYQPTEFESSAPVEAADRLAATGMAPSAEVTSARANGDK